MVHHWSCHVHIPYVLTFLVGRVTHNNVGMVFIHLVDDLEIYVLAACSTAMQRQPFSFSPGTSEDCVTKHVELFALKWLRVEILIIISSA